jgi:phosphate transport system permease protein
LPSSLIGVLLVVALPRLSRENAERFAFVLLYAAVAAVLLILAVILFDIVSKGLPALSWEFLTTAPRNLGREGGIFPAIVGTLYLVAGDRVALPLGVGAAIYLAEYQRGNLLTRLIRSGVDLLNGTPSIVFGLFGFSFLVLYLHFGVSLLAGQVTLGLMVLPTIVRTAEEALRQVPRAVREGSLALGATQVADDPPGRAPAGGTGHHHGHDPLPRPRGGRDRPDPLHGRRLLAAVPPDSVFDPVMALPYHLFILATNVPGAQQNTYGTALVLILLVCAFYAVAIVVRNHYQTTMRL